MSEKQTNEAPADRADAGVDALAASGDVPMVTVVIGDDVEGFIEGKPVKPGDTVELNFYDASRLVMAGHGEVTGTVKAKGAKK